MIPSQYQANYVHGLGARDIEIPDKYDFSVDKKIPVESFVVSRNSRGETVSRYGDDIWDLRSYRLAGDTGSARINFDFTLPSMKSEAKWLVFLILYVAEGETGKGLSISTIMNYIKTIRRLFLYVQENASTVNDIVSNSNELEKFVIQLGTRNLFSGFSAILGLLIKIPYEISGYRVVSYYFKYVANRKSREIPQYNQHSVIPPRILSILIDNLGVFLSEVSIHLDRLLGFMEKILTNDLFARCKSLQRKVISAGKSFQPHFYEASCLFGLEGLFAKYGVDCLHKLSRFITRMQHASRLYIHVYTGMRHSEVLSLKIGSLSETRNGNITAYKFIGETSKLVGQKKKVAWTTSRDSALAYGVANSVATLIANHVGIESSTSPLFISTSYLALSGPSPDLNEPIVLSRHGSKYQEIFEHFDQSYYEITNEDFAHLVKVDPFRTWHEEVQFRIGSVWRFTTHQFRRTLAYYVSQSGNVSLPALKSQLKHVTREMTLYYCNASSLSHEFDHVDHFSQLIKSMKTESDAIAYIDLIEADDEPLYGAYGRFVDKNIKHKNLDGLLLENREKIMKQFKRGELAYRETPLGACMTTAPCDKKLFRLISACVSCDRAVIKQSNLDRMIARQSLLVNELELQSADSIACRTEIAELESLQNFKKKMEKINENGGKI